MKLISREINAEQRLLALLAENSAQPDHEYLRPPSTKKLSSTRLWLPISRGETGNYLSLTVGTVNLALGYFQRKNYLAANKKEIEILDKQALPDLIHSPEKVD